MQLSDLRTAVRTRTGVASTDQLAGDTALTDLLNSALRRVVMDYPVGWPWYRAEIAVTTAAGTDTYPFKPGGTHSMHATIQVDKVLSVAVLIGQSYSTLERTNMTYLRDNYSFTGASAMPQAWCTNGRNLVLGPMPDAAYTLRVGAIIGEPTLTNGTDVPLLPDTFIDLLLDKASSMLAMRMRNPGDAQGFEVAYRGVLSAAKAYAKTYVGPSQVIEADMLRTSAAP